MLKIANKQLIPAATAYMGEVAAQPPPRRRCGGHLHQGRDEGPDRLSKYTDEMSDATDALQAATDKVSAMA